mmetsp:Transcript_35075/g.104674  ORF Transcript_35075/g.104674 Transcript_35075/m.104674 type:complete len:395 (-) Transcript_35075:42-1226(-)
MRRLYVPSLRRSSLDVSRRRSPGTPKQRPRRTHAPHETQGASPLGFRRGRCHRRRRSRRGRPIPPIERREHTGDERYLVLLRLRQANDFPQWRRGQGRKRGGLPSPHSPPRRDRPPPRRVPEAIVWRRRRRGSRRLRGDEVPGLERQLLRGGEVRYQLPVGLLLLGYRRLAAIYAPHGGPPRPSLPRRGVAVLQVPRKGRGGGGRSSSIRRKRRRHQRTADRPASPARRGLQRAPDRRRTRRDVGVVPRIQPQVLDAAALDPPAAAALPEALPDVARFVHRVGYARPGRDWDGRFGVSTEDMTAAVDGDAGASSLSTRRREGGHGSKGTNPEVLRVASWAENASRRDSDRSWSPPSRIKEWKFKANTGGPAAPSILQSLGSLALIDCDGDELQA